MTIEDKFKRKPIVLLVEDDAFDVQLIRTALARTPGEINLIRVEDGDKAVEYLNGDGLYEDRKKYPIPITVILDIKLPRRSGLEVLQCLRSQETAIRRLPALMLTSSMHQVDIDRAFEHGANAYIAKPESVKELTAMLGELKNFWFGRTEFPDVVGRRAAD
ncbi:MAG TPA: response regulator [Candidatus Angelobacter sp.]|nr:response regulator [Candidatus Angelobacter sp.]